MLAIKTKPLKISDELKRKIEELFSEVDKYTNRINY